MDKTTADSDVLLIPDYGDDPSDVLLSFPGIKAKTTQTLYQGEAIDKSTKGSVDEAIRPLVDLINRHPSFSTLSSCSGRISLFRPWGRTTNNDAMIETDVEFNKQGSDTLDPSSQKAKVTPESGKGRGGWLLVSHEVIVHSQLLTIFQNFNNEANASSDMGVMRTGGAEEEKDRVLMFKVEPMLLHVAAATHQRGRQLLALALELGFRESGLVIPSKRSNHRVTVAIRGVSLALTVPLAFRGALKPSEEYLRALVDQSNQRLERNQARLQQLFQSVQQHLFRSPSAGHGTMDWHCQFLPDLNLWGHDAAVLPACGPNTQASDVDVLVFGGYGQGPVANLENENEKFHCQRNGNVYCLQRRQGLWVTDWIELKPTTTSSSRATIHMESLRIDVKVTNFTPREGATVCLFGQVQGNSDSDKDPTNRIAGIWGGRKGPHHALDEFLLYDHSDNKFVAPIDIRGELPEARWGHSLTRLDFSTNDPSPVQKLALLLGGRNERAALGTAHVLSLVSADRLDGSGHFLWETICFPPDLQQPSLPFHHATVVVPDGESAAVHVFVFGGLSNPCNPLEAFSLDEPLEASDSGTASDGHFQSSFSLSLKSSDALRTQPFNLCASSVLNESLGVGRAVVLLDGLPLTETQNLTCQDRHWMLWSGEAPSEIGNRQDADQNSSNLRIMELARTRSEDGPPGNDWILQPSPQSVPGEIFEGLEDSVMVHHRALVIPSREKNTAEVLLVGGGAMGFAFGPCFSRCFQLSLQGANSKSIASGSHSTFGKSGQSNKKIPLECPDDAKALCTDVVYVRKQNAKAMKTALEKLSFLDKRFRMTPVTSPDEIQGGKEIAVPIMEDCLNVLNRKSPVQTTERDSWASLVEGIGRQEMPFSTSQFARKKGRK